MTEHTFVRSIHRGLAKADPEVYIWKINDNYQGGVADAYYSKRRDCWVEYKYIRAFPKRPATRIDLGLSQLQKDWLIARHNQGRNVAVVAGSEHGAVIFPGVSWDRVITRDDFLDSAVDKKEVVAYIQCQLTPI
jgi:hypothetical protein